MILITLTLLGVNLILACVIMLLIEPLVVKNIHNNSIPYIDGVTKTEEDD
jgi:hypothetical protein